MAVEAVLGAGGECRRPSPGPLGCRVLLPCLGLWGGPRPGEGGKPRPWGGRGRRGEAKVGTVPTEGALQALAAPRGIPHHHPPTRPHGGGARPHTAPPRPPAPPAPQRPLQVAWADLRHALSNQRRRRAVTVASLRQSKAVKGGTGESRVFHRKCTPGTTSSPLPPLVPPPAPSPRSDGPRQLSPRLPES